MEGAGDEAHGRVQSDLCEQSVTRLGHNTLLLSSKAPEHMTTEYWRWHPRWNRLASSAICFCCIALKKKKKKLLHRQLRSVVSSSPLWCFELAWVDPS